MWDDKPPGLGYPGRVCPRVPADGTTTNALFRRAYGSGETSAYGSETERSA
jgi:hypothetical protein